MFLLDIVGAAFLVLADGVQAGVDIEDGVVGMFDAPVRRRFLLHRNCRFAHSSWAMRYSQRACSSLVPAAGRALVRKKAVLSYDALLVEIEGAHFCQGGPEAGRELRVVVEDFDQCGGLRIFVLGEVGADFPDQGVVTAGGGEVECFFERSFVFPGWRPCRRCPPGPCYSCCRWG